MSPQFHASNPARIRIHFFTFLRSHPIAPTFILGALVLSFLLLLCGADLKLQVIPAALLFAALMGLHEARNVFESGNLCPAIVIDDRRGLVAAYTDLSTEGSPCPAIDVFTAYLGMLSGGPYKNGDRLALAAFYKGNPNAPHWLNFGGYFVQAGTPKQKLWKRALESIDEEEWDMLEAGIAELKQPFRKGLYLNLKFQHGRKPSLASRQPRMERDTTNDSRETPEFVQVQCPNCREILKSKRPEILGKRLACPHCKELFVAKAYKPARKPAEGDDLFESDPKAVERETHRSPLLLWITTLGLFVLLIFGVMFFMLPPGKPPGGRDARQPPDQFPQPGNPFARPQPRRPNAQPPNLAGQPIRNGVLPPRRKIYSIFYGERHELPYAPFDIPIPQGYKKLDSRDSLPPGTKVKFCEDKTWKSATVMLDRELLRVWIRRDEPLDDPDLIALRMSLIVENTTLSEIRQEVRERLQAARKHQEEMQKNAPRLPQKLPDSPDAPVKLVLTEVGEQKTEIAALIVEITDLSLKEAEEFISDPPLVLMQNVPKWEAEKWVEQIKKAGGTAVIENVDPEAQK